MKSFVASLVLALMIILGSIGYTIYLDNLSEEMCLYNDEIKEFLMNDRYDEAENAARLLSEFIDDKKIALASTMDHNNLDNIERNIAELIAYTGGEQRFDALAKCEVLKIMFEHLPKNYSFKLENIL